MKKISMSVMAVFFGLLSVCSNMSAQDFSMLSSRARCESYAREQVTGVSASMSAFGGLGKQSWSDQVVTTWDGIEEAINSLSLHLEVVNPADPIFRDVYAMSEDGQIYFQSYRKFWLQPDKSPLGYSIPLDVLSVTELELAPNVPVRVPGVVSAELLILGEDGETLQSRHVYSYSGYVYFPTDFLGANVILRVTVPVPTTAEMPPFLENLYWSVKDNEQIHTLPFDVGFKGSIKNSLVFKDVAYCGVSLKMTNHVGITPLIVYKSTKTQKTSVNVYLVDQGVIIRDDSIMGPSYETHYWIGAWVRKVGSGKDFVYYPVLVSHMSNLDLEVEPGSYHIIPDFGDGVIVEPKSEVTPPPPYPDGKG